MKLIVGLGNPGEDYKLTRHNLGFMVVEELAQRHNISFRMKERLKTAAAEGEIGEEVCYLAMPLTFMNLSGHSVRSIIKWLKIELSEVLVVADDIALPFGDFRIRSKGSDGGHKGLRSIIECIGTSDFSRLRIGIRGRDSIKDLSGYVLNRFTRNERKLLPDMLNCSSQACECWVKDGIEKAMNKYN